MNNKTKVFAALALTAAFGVGMALQTKFSDVPANLWAEGAVNRMVAEGIINGYPDGTFKGNNSVNRYEVTTMFDRLVSGKRLAALQNNAQAGAQVSSDISALRAANVSNAGTIAVLQADLAALKAAAGTPTTLGSADNTALGARITELEAKIAAMSSTDTAAFNERIVALEASVKAMSEAEKPTNPELEARLSALETNSSSAAALTSKLEQQDARVTALEGQVKTLNTTVAALERTVGERPTTTTPTGTTPTTPTTPDTTETPVTPTSAAPSIPTLVISGGISTNLIPSTGFNAPLGLGAFVAVGLNLSESFSIRLSGDFSEIPSAGANLLFNLGGGLYAGLGGGLVFAGGGLYAGGVLGFGFDIATNFGLFIEANPRFNFTSSSFGVKTSLGLRLGL